MKPTILLDTGPLVALFYRRDQHHQWARQQVAQLPIPLFICEPALTADSFLLWPTQYNQRAMTQLDLKQTIPLVMDDDGGVRIIGSRVTLDSIVDEFKRGATAEQILADFPSLTLREVYGTIAYYLEHTATVEEYLHARAAAGEEMRRWIEEKLPTTELRERLRAHRG